MIRREIKTEMISPVCICDIEISNEIKQEDGSWDYSKSDIITLGIYYLNKIIILQREKTDKIDFWKDCLNKELKDKPVMFSLNIKMEKLSIKGFLGLNKFFEEIMPMKGKGVTKENLFKDLEKKKQIPKINMIRDPLKGKSSLVKNKYAENKYEEIISHNYSCLMKEFFIFINRCFFLESYKDKLKNGWWYNDKPFGEHY